MSAFTRLVVCPQVHAAWPACPPQVYLRENGDIGKATERLLLKHEHTLFVEKCKDSSSAYPQYALQVQK
jgi:hypothetical protein